MNLEFSSKHQSRDNNLVKDRQKLRNHIEYDLSNDNDVLAVFYSGSIARGNEDIYSDIDLRVVVRDETFRSFISNKTERPKKWGQVLFIEDGRPYAPYSVAHFKNFVKVDTFYYKLSDLNPSIYLKEESAVVYDPYNLIKDLKLKSENKEYELTIGVFETWRSKFFAYLHETYRRTMRGEIYYALQNLDLMRWSIVTGWYMEKGFLPNDYGCWSKYEGERSKLEGWQLTLLKSWDSSRDKYSIVNSYKVIIPEFIQLHKILCEKLGIEENIEWINEVIGMVI